jgi:hypothetical protein
MDMTTYWKSFENVAIKDVHRLAGTFEFELPEVSEQFYIYVWESDHEPPFFATMSHTPCCDGEPVNIVGGYWYTVERTASEFLKGVQRQLADLPDNAVVTWVAREHPVHV